METVDEGTKKLRGQAVTSYLTRAVPDIAPRSGLNADCGLQHDEGDALAVLVRLRGVGDR